jgi:hypothetical protein
LAVEQLRVVIGFLQQQAAGLMADDGLDPEGMTQ